MSRIRSRDTRPELLLRSALWSAGLRYRVHAPELPGRPDVVFYGPRVVVFVDGCFWHGCPLHYGRPRSAESYWTAKLSANVARDSRRTLELEAAGWHVLRVWEHEVRRALDDVVARIRAAVKGGPAEPDQWRVVAVVPEGDQERRELHLLREPDQVRYEVGPRVQRHV